MDTSGGPPPDGPLRDRHGRAFDYVRIAVNELCNLRCVYCMPPEGLLFKTGPELLTGAEILRLVRILARLGVRKVRFTGGEPLLREDLPALIAGAAATPGITSVHLTTNGLLLRRRLGELLAAGLHGVNISLDTLQPERYRRITRRGGHEEVLAALEAALAAGIPAVKVNVVALRGFNDDELLDFVALTKERPITVRFIELMPFDARQVWRRGHFFKADWILEVLREALPALEPVAGSATEATIFRVPGFRGKVAVIPAYTRSLCGHCNRIRVTADGRIRNCLFAAAETDVKSLLRHGADDARLAQAFREAMWAKAADGWEAQRRGGDGRASMTQIGG